MSTVARDLLIGLINEYLVRKGSKVTSDSVSISTPIKLSEVVSKTYDRNTRVVVTNVKNSKDKANVYYNRLSLPILFGAPDVPVDVDFLSVETAVEAINRIYGTFIEMTDLKTFELIPNNRARIVMGASYLYLEDSELIIYPDTDLTRAEAAADRLYRLINFSMPAIQNELLNQGGSNG